MKMKSSLFIFLSLASAVCCVLFLPACSDKNKMPPRPAIPVTVATVLQKTVPVELRAIGNVEAYSTVGVKAQIGGELLRVHFKEGQDVNKGDILFTIDPRPYEAALRQAEATLARDTAQMENARVEADRYAKLVDKGYVAKEQSDQMRTNAVALEAIVNADKAAVDNAKLQVKYCYIYSPITGRTGNLASNQGNLIKANADTSMVTINQIQPIYVTFSVPEQYLTDIKRHMKTGKLNVDAFMTRDDKRSERGILTFVDNAVDTTTGTIRLKATFGNKERALWPGQFVNVRITLTEIKDAVTVLSSAVQTGQQGQFVFVIKEYTAEIRPVSAGTTYEDMTVIEKGLTPGEQVVTDGQMQLMPGAKVEIRKPQEQNGKESLGTGNTSKDKKN